MTTIKESSQAHLTLVHVFHAYASVDSPWTAHALSRVSPMRYGRVLSNSVTVEASKFVGHNKIPYAPVHNSNLLIGARQSVLNRHRRGLPPWSSEFWIRSLILLPIQYSPFSPNCPPGLQLCQPFDHLAKPRRTSVDRKGPITSGF
jgi:hypothetical protein